MGRWACRSARVLQALIITPPKSVLQAQDEAPSVPRHCPPAPGTAYVLPALGLPSSEVGGAGQRVTQAGSDHGKMSPAPGSDAVRSLCWSRGID